MSKKKYIGVKKKMTQSGMRYEAQKKHNGKVKSRTFETEREAAKGYDIMCIDFGLEPVNILKRVEK